MNFFGKRVLIVGLAESGISVAKYLLKQGSVIIATDLKESVRDKFKDYPLNKVKLVLGDHPLSLLEGIDLLIVSPGVSLDIPLIQKAYNLGIPVWGEIELAYRFTKSPIIAITETHGKSTTTSLIYKMLLDGGIEVGMGGNIRPPLTEIIEKVSTSGWLVVEVSSFQLETIKEFHPRIALILNIYEDHLNRHETLEKFQEIISRIYMNMTSQDLLIGNADDMKVLSLMENSPTSKAYFAKSDHKRDGVFIVDKSIKYRWEGREGRIISIEEVPLLGEHNLENVMAASVAAIAVGVNPEALANSIRNFKGLPHRLEFVREIRGVSFYNDSKATAPKATLVALKSIKEKKILILGGSDKDVDYSELTEKLKSYDVKQVVLMGETRFKLEKYLLNSGFLDYKITNNLAEAIVEAFKQAKSGEVILLSPACASYDQFKDFEDRGKQFKELVNSLS